MASSNLTVSGITPTLTILGQYQDFAFILPVVSFKLTNNWPVSAIIPSQTNFEFRNNTLSGYRFAQITTNSDISGELKLEIFQYDNVSGTRVFKIDEDNTMLFDATVTLSSNPTVPFGAATKQYVDMAIAGITFSSLSYAATLNDLNAIYDNGTSGVGATLTNNGALATFSVDNIVIFTGSRILVKDQNNSFENGIYDVTVLGDGATPWVLTRSSDYDEPGEMAQGTFVPIEKGETNGKTLWFQTSVVNTVGTDPVTYDQFIYNPNRFLEKANNLSDLANIVTARSNLGLTDIAIQSVTANSVLVGGLSNSIISVVVPSASNRIFSSVDSAAPQWSDISVNYPGVGNIFVGFDTGLTLTTAIGCSAFGDNALVNVTSGRYNSAFGVSSSQNLTAGEDNSSFGKDSLVNAVGTNSTSAFGSNAGALHTTYTDCTFLGANADAGINGLTNVIAIGEGTIVNTSDTCGIGIAGTDLVIGEGTGNITGLNAITDGAWNGDIIDVLYGGTGAGSFTNNALLLGTGTSPISEVTPGTMGTVLVGVTGSAPVFSDTPIVSSITINNSPVSPTDGVNKAYADALIAGINFKELCYAASISNFTATYNNGVGGVGATLTNNSAFVVFNIDGQSPGVNDRVLIKNQTNAFQNGVYVVTNVGSPATAWVLTRATDYDDNVDIMEGNLVPVQHGVVNYGSSWLQTSVVTVIGTDPIDFIPFTYSADSFLQKMNNLSDVLDVPTSRTNLGLTNVAIQSVTDNSVLVGGPSNSIESTALLDGQLLIGSTGTNPAASVPTDGTNISWTTGAGTLQANISGEVGAVNGGTGRSFANVYSVICGGTTPTGVYQSLPSNGNAGQVLTSTGPSSLPTWADSSSGGGGGSYAFATILSNFISTNTSSSTPVKVLGTYNGTKLNNFSVTSNTIRYDGVDNIVVSIVVNISYSIGGTKPDFVNIYVYKNGSILSYSISSSTPIDTGFAFGATTTVIEELSTNDYLELYMSTPGEFRVITVNNMLFNISQI